MKNKIMTELEKDKYIKQLEQENEVLSEKLGQFPKCTNCIYACRNCSYYKQAKQNNKR